MAGSTIGRKLQGHVVWIGRAVVIGRMTPGTGVWGAVVIPIVAACTIIGNRRVRTVQGVIIVVDRETGRFPARRRGVTHRTIRRKVQGTVVRIGRLIEIGRMATCTGIGRVGVVPSGMTKGAVVLNGNVRTGKRINGIMVKAGRRPSRFAVAGRTIGWELCCNVIWTGGSVVLGGVTTRTGIGCAVVISVVTGRAIVGYGRVRSV